MPRFEPVLSVDDPLTLPIAGRDGVVRDYAVQPCTAAEFVAVSAMQKTALLAFANRADRRKLASDVAAAKDAARVPESQDDIYSLTLGADVYKQMLADEVSGQDLVRASRTAFQWHLSGGDLDAAAKAWAGGKAPTSPATH